MATSKSAKALKAEAAKPTLAEALDDIDGDEAFTFTWKDDEYTVLAEMEWDFEAVEALENRHMTGVIKGAISAADLMKFRSKRPNARDTMEFFGLVMGAAGVEPGESTD